VNRNPEDRVMEDKGRDPDIQEKRFGLPQFRGGDDHPFPSRPPAQRRYADLPATTMTAIHAGTPTRRE